ncbi:hypothetical protein ANO14919_069640 [Xylariales sp. No.14919]|nr:hypothetical protein ANO14919_069640 [Xylariales sp. No.14919]
MGYAGIRGASIPEAPDHLDPIVVVDIVLQRRIVTPSIF